LVTGVSTGALIAPMALLGPKYDDRLKEAYTTIGPENIYRANPFFGALFGDSLAENGPLKALISKYYSEDVLEEIAKAYRRGQRIYIGTTDLDSDRLTIWNLGKIAASGNQNSLELFHQIILASASIPGAFPPVLFDVDVNGKTYDELHVDGGMKAQMFFYAGILNLKKARENFVKPDSRLYIIRNGLFSPNPDPTKRSVVSILGKSFSSLTKTSGLGDAYRIYAFTQRDGIDYNYIALPATYEKKSKEPFNHDDMNSLFQIGNKKSITGIKWRKHPPGL